MQDFLDAPLEKMQLLSVEIAKKGDQEMSEQIKHIGSVFEDQQELLSALIKLYSPEGIELDPMYHKGNFYLDVEKPKMMFDINPTEKDCGYADARKLPLEKNSINSMILDPPFVFGVHGKNGTHQKNNRMAKEFGIFDSFRELSLLYQEILYEAYRILKKSGTLIFKCQDYTDSKTTLTHCYVYQWAMNVGFKVEDIAILNNTNHKIYNPNLTQRHLRKYHTYFLVMKK